MGVIYYCLPTVEASHSLHAMASSSHLHRLVLFIGAPATAMVLAAGLFFANQTAVTAVEAAGEGRLNAHAFNTRRRVADYLARARQEAALIATTPSIIAAARAGAALSASQGLDTLPIEVLESRFESSRVLGGDPELTEFLVNIETSGDLAELFFTEANGLVVLTSQPTSDFVQSDEVWWQQAFQNGSFDGEPTFDESAATASVEFSARIDDPATGDGLGVLKTVIDLTELQRLMVVEDMADAAFEVVTASGVVVATTSPERLLLEDGRPEGLQFATGRTVTRTEAFGSDDVVITVPVERDWWLVARQPWTQVTQSAATVRRTLIVGAIVMFVAATGLLFFITRWLERQFSQPIRSAGAVAGKIADGDLTASLTARSRRINEVAQLMASIDRMVGALRTLVTAIRQSAEDSAAMAEEISASTEQMSASAEQMASTCQHLTQQASEQASLIHQTATDANRILEIASSLNETTTESAARNAQLAHVATQHREELTESSHRLEALASDIDQGAEDAESLVTMSAQIDNFVVQAKAIAAQTKMLSLNAAIEASRADGGESRGFGVVADEVRKLAGQASRSAAATSETVKKVYRTIENTRSRMQRLSEGSSAIRDVADSAVSGLSEVVSAAEAQQEWSKEISESADQAKQFVSEITERLRALSEGTNNFLAAAEQIAATAEEQTASTQEIASSANQLAEASERLTADVSSFQVLRNGHPKLPTE